MGDTIARYLHTSLYSFNADARAEVIKQFNTEIGNNGSVNCWYDPSRETFFIECPTSLGIGATVDGTLADVVGRYIESELEAAERQEREPTIHRFAEGKFDALDNFADPQNEGEAAPPARPTETRPPPTHLVVVAEGEARTVKLLKFHSLPDRLMERTLAPRNDRVQQIFVNGLTCRAVRWTSREGHVFNGRTGAGQSLPMAQSPKLQLPDFPKLEGEEPESVTEVETEAPTEQQWEFVGEPVTMESWLRGTGETRQVDPKVKPEMPKDARRYLVGGPPNATGRVRVPKGSNLLPEETEEDTERSSDEDDNKKQGVAFNDLLSGRLGATEENDSESEDDTSDGSEKTVQNTFADLVGRNGKQPMPIPKRKVSGDWGLFRPEQPTSRPATTITPLPSPGPSRQPNRMVSDRSASHYSPANASIAQEEAPPTNEEFPSYGQSFATVDDIGLTANASSTAQWESQHYTHQEPKKKSKPVVPRSSYKSSATGSRLPTDNSAVASSTDTEQHRSSPKLRENQTKASTSMATVQQASREVPDEANWTNTLAGDNRRPPKLVDDMAAHRAGPIDIPPGFAPLQVESKGLAENTRPARMGKLVDMSENVLEASPPKRTVAMSPDAHTTLTPITVRKTSDDSDDEIVERVKALPPNYAQKRNTMRQKASKKGKGKGKPVAPKPSGAKASLPLPDPVPPPKPKKQEGAPSSSAKPKPQAKAKQEKKRISTKMGNVEESSDEDQGIPAAKASTSRIDSVAHGFGKTLHALKRGKARQEEEDEEDLSKFDPGYKLESQIGIHLLRPADKSVHQPALPPDAMQKELDGSSDSLRSDFVPRITTSTEDATFLYQLADPSGESELTGDAFYEVHIRDAAGTSCVIQIPMQLKPKQRIKEYTVRMPKDIVGELNAHYPSHVFDVRTIIAWRGNDYQSPAEKAIETFVKSMHTGEEDSPPSFKAIAPPGIMTVQRILSKRVFEIKQDEITFRAMEVQDLEFSSWEPGNGASHNFTALASNAEDMIEDQRLWWEATWETRNLDKAGEVKAKVEEMIASMDVVGLENKGPYVYQEPEPEEEEKQPEVPFW